MTVTLTSCKVYAYLDAGWTDLTADSIGSLNATWGISGNTPNDRLADTGTLRFTLRNTDGSYTPNSATALDGWRRGTKIKVVMVYGADEYVRFYGIVDAIDINAQSATVITANVTVVDWMNYCAEHPIMTPALATDKRADEAINLLLSDMPRKPLSKSLDEGISTFPSVFDLVRSKTVMLSELQKIIESEMGYIYLRKDKANGEQLVFENAQHRNGLIEPSTVILVNTDKLLLETNDKILLETNDKILLDETQTVTLSNFNAINVEHGSNTANRIVVTAYPRKIDTALVILYSLGSPIEIGNGETKTFTANYSDPNGGSSAGGMNMVPPVATTDYTVNTLRDGLGTDLTSSATVHVTFGASNASVTVTNTSISSGFITFFRLRGYGVYTYASTEYALENSSDINEFGYFERRFNQKYQGELADGALAAQKNLFYDHHPRTILQSITFLANKTDSSMLAFLSNDIGSLIEITESTIGTTGAYFIQNISFTVESLGIIWVTYGLMEHWSYLTDTMIPITGEFGGSPEKIAVNYGYLPQVVQTSERSYSAWIWDYGDVYGPNGNAWFTAPFADGGGIYLEVGNLHRIVVYSNLFNVTPGTWNSPTNSLPVGGWYHVVITFDVWDVDALPVIYIDGVSQAITESSNPAGVLNSEYGAEVVVGNWHTATHEYSSTWDGKIKDPRIYNRILSAGEVTTLYNAGIPDVSLVTSGLVFQGLCAPANFEGWSAYGAWDTITVGDMCISSIKKQFLDNIYQAVGRPIPEV